MHHLLETWFGWVLTGGYTGIIVLMAMESSIFPVPSEMVIPPAAFLAAQGKLSFAGVVLAGMLGSYLGSAMTYWASRLIGRLFREAASGCSPSDLDSSRDRSDEFRPFQFCDDRRVGALVFDSGLSRRQSLSHRAGAANESGSGGPFYPRAIEGNIVISHTLRRSLPIDLAVDEAAFLLVVRPSHFGGVPSTT